MSSARGSAYPRGRGRGSTQLGSRGRGRGASTSRGRVFNNATSQRGNPASRAGTGFGQFARGTTGGAARGLNNTRGNAFAQTATTRASFGGARTGGNWQERYNRLTKSREREREDAIRQGLVADPDKPRALSEAITPVGTCQDLCAEFERVQRVVQQDVWVEEKGTDQEPDESRMVKKFRRAAAGLEEQLPSDLRSPQTLKQTCDYLFDEVIGNASSLAQVHHFVWDRTRAIRNDFSIQQLTKLEDLRIAVDCYERIARFHILSMHQLASPERPYSKYDWPQEREQLDRTLLSLLQYYEDARGRFNFPNEADFRVYWLIFQLRGATDLEDIVQAWPRSILRNQRVRKALEVYAAGGTAISPLGPLKPHASPLIARQDWQRFWVLLESNEISYLTGCVAEIWFQTVRKTVLNALFRTFRANFRLPTDELTLDVLCELFAFDEEEEVQTYCEQFGFAFRNRNDGQTFLDLSSITGRVLPEQDAEAPKQLKSSLVENKRLGRTLPAVINGLTVRQAQDAGLVVEEEHDEGMEDVNDGETGDAAGIYADQPTENDEDSLFIPEDNKPKATQPDSTPALTNGLSSETKPSPFSWGKPSGGASPFSSAAPKAQSSDGASKPAFDFLSGGAKSEANGTNNKPSFNFLGAAPKPAEKAPAGASGFNFLGSGAKAADATAESKSPFSFPVSSAPSTTPAPAAKFDFTASAPLGGFSAASQDAGRQTIGNNGKATATRGQTETASPQNDLFSKPAQEQSSAPNPFNFAAPVPTKTSSPERPAATKPQPLQLPSSFAPTSNGPKPATVESAPTSPESPPNPFLQPPPKSPAQTASETTPSFPSHQNKQAQPHYTAPSSNIQPSFSTNPPSPSNLNTNIRRPSTSTDTKPKKPSPLSNSFTATDDSSGSARAPSATSTAAKASATEKPLIKETPVVQQHLPPKFQQVNAAAPAEEGHLKKPIPFKRPPPPPDEVVESLDVTVTRIANELVNDPISGYLKQYVEYQASQIITSVQEQIAAEKMAFRLSELRISTVFRKYFKKWVGVIWQKRMVKSGKERRQRRRKRLEDGFDDGSSRGDRSVRGSSPGSEFGTSSWKGHQESVDARFQRTMNSRSLARPMHRDQQARPGSKRPSSSHGENGVVARASAHKRLKSTSHVDDRGRVVKPAAPSQHDDILKRSSFLGFSVNGRSPPSKNTTKTNYFRLKAMGVHRADELSAPRGTKRPRTESAQPLATSPPHLRKSTSTAPSPEDSTTRSLMPPPSSTLSRAQKAKEEDDVLFARIRAARDSLTVGAVYMNQEVAKDEELRRSLSASQSSNESPSMIKARADARARASRAGSPEQDVPAYRLRESKFVPREHYGRAIEKAKELRESRSRDVSRPASRPASRLDQPAEKTPSQALGFSFSPVADNSERAQEGPTNGLPRAKSPEMSPTPGQAPPWFSPIEGPNGITSWGKNAPPELSLDSNPFLQSTVPETTGNSNMDSPFNLLPSHPDFVVTQPSFSPGETFQPQSGFGKASAFGRQDPFSPQSNLPPSNLPPSHPDYVVTQPSYSPQEAFQPQSGFGKTSTFGLQNPFSPQKPVSGFQSAFGTQSATQSRQDPFSPQQPVSGFQSAFGAQSAANSNPFKSGFASTFKSGFGAQPAQSSFAAPQDQTIHPELIGQSLADSFGSHREESNDEPRQSHGNDPVPPQQSSYMNTQPLSLLSDDEDDQDIPASVQIQRPQVNGFDDGDEELIDDVTDEEGYQPPYGHANPFALLADQNNHDEPRPQSQATGDEMYDQDRFDQDEEQLGNGFESQEDNFSNDGDVGFDDQYYGGEDGEDEEAANGDIDESDVHEDGDEEDGFDSDDDEGDDDEEEEESGLAQPWQKIEPANSVFAKPAPPPMPNAALQGMGKTEDAPIELDSD